MSLCAPSSRATWKTCRELITCDAESCDATNPKHRCSRCHMVFYCSPSCQRAHWKVHRPDCVSVEDMRRMNIPDGKGNGPVALEDATVTHNVLSDPNTTCGICFASHEEIKHPVVLKDCHHAFCYSCLKRWNDAQIQMMAPAATCPMCRRAMPNVTDTPLNNASYLLSKAQCVSSQNSVVDTDAADSEQYGAEELCQQALQEIHKLEATIQADDNIMEPPPRGELPDLEAPRPSLRPKSTLEIKVQIAILQAEAYLLLGQPDTAVDTLLPIVSPLRDCYQRHLQTEALMDEFTTKQHDPSQEERCEELLHQLETTVQQGQSCSKDTIVDTLLKVGQAQREAQQWTQAKETYQSLFRDFAQHADSLSPRQNRELFFCLAECAHHLGHYAMAVDLGQAAIEMNRSYPWCHRRVALAQLAQGNRSEAQRIAAEGVLYETPWDEQHQHQVLDWYESCFVLSG